MNENELDDGDEGEASISLDKLVKATNICDLLDDDEIKEIGSDALAGYQQDLSSRTQWEERNANAMKLALQVT